MIRYQEICLGSENQVNVSSDELENIRTILERFREESSTSSNDMIYVTVISFLTGIALVLFGLYLTKKDELTKKMYILYRVSVFSLAIPSTIILVQYIVTSIITEDPLHGFSLILVGFLLLIPLVTLYVLMAVTHQERKNID
jgi:hypothetical protein